MAPSKSRWGIVLGIFSIITAGLAVLILLQFPPSKYGVLYKTAFPVVGIILALLSFFIGHFSYPRVHNLKVYLLGYLTGITGLAYFLLYRIPVRNDAAITGLLLLIFINFIGIIFIPSYVKYHITKRITFILVGCECALMLLARFNPSSIAWARYLARGGFFHIASLIALLWFLNILVISIYRIRDEFYLGGLLSGCALLYYLMWLTPLIFSRKYAPEAEKVLMVLATLYLEIGIFIHWLSRMEHRISYDPLLQIYNRNYCSKIIEEQSRIKTTPPIGVAMVDIDHFKKVNDSYGHQAGDKVLYSVAQCILREVIPEGIACRYGGEEIIVFFPNKRTKDISPIMQNVRKSVQRTKVPWKRKKLSVSVSCGISHRESSAQTIMDVIHSADKALYRAKKGGRNQVKTSKTPHVSSKKK